MSLKKELSLFLACAKIEAMDRMDNLLGFSLVTAGTILRTGITVIFFKSLYGQVSTIGGWSEGQVMILLGTYMLIEDIAWASYIRGFLNRIPRYIERGDLDVFLTKPINLRSFLVYGYVDVIFSVVQAVPAIALLVYGFSRDGQALNILSYLFFLVCALVLHCSLTIIISTINFYHLIPQASYLADEIFKLGRYPITIYHGFARFLLSIIIPLAAMYSVPAESLFGNLAFKAYLSTFLITIIFYLLSKFFWQLGIKRYESANG